MNGSHVEVQQLLLERGGKYFRKGVGFVDCTSSDGTPRSAQDYARAEKRISRTCREL